MRRNIYIFLMGMSVLFNSTLGYAEEIVIFGNEYKPPKYYLENGKPKGILIDIMRYVEEQTNYTFDINLYPWARAYHLANLGDGGIIGLSMTKERLAIFDYSAPMYYDDIVLVVVKGQEFAFETLEDLAGKVIGVNRGASYGDEFERGKKDIFRVNEDNNPVARLKMILARRIDAALIGPGKAGLQEVISSDPELMRRSGEFAVLPKPFKRDPNYLGFAKTMKMQDFISEFNRLLQQGYQDGTIQGIINRYGK
jgi:polar amino acid transport system substrate-binding protein